MITIEFVEHGSNSGLDEGDTRRDGGCQQAPMPKERPATARAAVARGERITITCEFCGSRFESYARGARGLRRFCSPTHRNRAYYCEHREQILERGRQRYQRRAARPAEQACARCGKTFPASGRAIYCGQTCRQLAYFKRRRDQARMQREGRQ